MGLKSPIVQQTRTTDDTIEFVEVCPECGQEIDIFLPKHSHAIPFCPHCGHPSVWLCSKCMEMTDCNRKDPRAFCYKKDKLIFKDVLCTYLIVDFPSKRIWYGSPWGNKTTEGTSWPSIPENVQTTTLHLCDIRDTFLANGFTLAMPY